MNTPRRQILKRIVKLFTIFIGLIILYVSLDYFSVDSADKSGQKISIPLPKLEPDRAYFFKLENKQIVIVRYSTLLQQSLKLNSSHSGYFIAYALGTYLGCPLEVVDDRFLKESCSSARYDFAGQPVDSNNFPALPVPVYNFCDDFSCVNLRI